MKYNDNGTVKEIKVKVFDTLPIGTEVDYDGSTVPSGWTDTTDSWHTLNSTIKYKKSGNVVTVTGFSSNTISLSENDYTTVGTLPSGYRPGEQLNNVWNELGVAYSNTIRIGTNGTIQLYSTKNTAYWVFTLTYVIDNKVIQKTSQYIEGGASLSNVYGTSDENGYTQEYINGLHTPTITTISGINYIKYGHIVFMSGMLTANVASGDITLAYKPKWDCGFAITGFYPQTGNIQANGYVYMVTNNLTASYKANAAFTVAPISAIYYTDD